jgi:AcrR family transcriptional regulator
MREWVPVSSSPKGRLALAAVREFGARRFEDVTVGELATQAEVTTGALYHHFESKIGLYQFVRADVERRLLDRMAGAAEAAGPGPAGLHAALLVGFDYAVRSDFHRLLGAPPTRARDDLLVDFLATQASPASRTAGLIAAAAWRAALLAVADGAEPAEVRAVLTSVTVGGAGERAGSG